MHLMPKLNISVSQETLDKFNEMLKGSALERPIFADTVIKKGLEVYYTNDHAVPVTKKMTFYD